MRFPKMKGSVLLLIYCAMILPPSCLQFDIFVNENVRQTLDYLCPGVNICNKDVPDTKPNAVARDENISCCKGCSCDAECHLSLNCCFPQEYSNRTIDSSDVSSDEKELNQIGKTSDNRSKQAGVTDKPVLPSLIQKRMAVLGQTATETIQTTMSSTNITAPNYDGLQQLSPMKCTYARTRDQDIIGYETAFRMISRPPLGGCNPNPKCQRLVNQNMQATCDDDVSVPWGGDLFPVYSSAHQLIFKNEYCACCHGVSEYEHWAAVVVCKTHNWRGDVSMAEHFHFLQATHNSSSNHCFLSFSFYDVNVLLQNACYMDTLGECMINMADPWFEVPEGVAMTQQEIVEACHNGPNAPFLTDYIVFKNVFCAMCDFYLTWDRLECIAGLGIDLRSGGMGEFTYVLDTTFMQGASLDNNKPVPYPTACLKKNNKWVEESCRVVECPTGQIRDARGLCMFPSKRWFHGVYELGVELEYVDKGVSILTMLENGVVTLKDVEDALANSKPWPSNWAILTMQHSTREYPFHPRIALYLAVHTMLPEMLTVQIKASMKLQWNVLLNGKHIAFSQSYLKYTMNRGFLGPEQAIWTPFADKIPNIPANENVTWEGLLTRVGKLGKLPIMLNKLLTCEHIALLEGEFTVVENTILLNRLTNKVMFDLEFDVADMSGRIAPHVCLSDTPLVLRLDQNGAPTLHSMSAIQILVIILLQIYRMEINTS